MQHSHNLALLRSRVLPPVTPATYSCSFRTVSPQPSIVVSVSHCLMMGCSSTNVFGWYFSGVWIQRSLLEVNCTLCSALKDHSQSDVLWKKGTLNNLELSGQPCSPCSVFLICNCNRAGAGKLWIEFALCWLSFWKGTYRYHYCRNCYFFKYLCNADTQRASALWKEMCKSADWGLKLNFFASTYSQFVFCIRAKVLANHLS